MPIKLRTKRRKPRILLIDAANLLIRIASVTKALSVCIGINRPPTKDTDQTKSKTKTRQEFVTVKSGAIFGVIRTILMLHNKYKFDNLVFCMEGDTQCNPRRKNPIYKAKRPSEKSVDITTEMIYLRQLLQIMGCLVAVPLKGEADDVVGSLTKQFRKKYEIFILSADHDMQALLGRGVTLLKPGRGSGAAYIEYTKKTFAEKYPFKPCQYPLYSAVIGDSSDNIPGIKGVGPAKFLSLYKRLHQADKRLTIKNIAEGLAAAYKKLGSAAEIAELITEYYDLTKIRTEWEVEVLHAPLNLELVRACFEILRMRGYLAQFDKLSKQFTDWSMKRNAMIQMLKTK